MTHLSGCPNFRQVGHFVKYSVDAIHSRDMAGLMISALLEIERRRACVANVFFETGYIETEYDDCL
jgi:hypothetical protein